MNKRQDAVGWQALACIISVAMILSACKPSQDQLAAQTTIVLTTTIDASPTVTPVPTKQPTNTPTITASPEPSSTPQPTPLRTATVNPTATIEESETPSVISTTQALENSNLADLCLTRKTTVDRAAILADIFQPSLSLEQVVEQLKSRKYLINIFPSIIVFFPENSDPKQGWVGDATCAVIGMSEKEIISANEEGKWGLTLQTIYKCEEVSLLPMLPENFGSPTYWPQSPNEVFTLDFKPSGCSWTKSTLNPGMSTEIGKYVLKLK